MLEFQPHDGRAFRKSGVIHAERRDGQVVVIGRPGPRGPLALVWDWHFRADNPLPHDVVAYAFSPCEHDYHREPYGGPTVVYSCSKCGDEYERDVS